MEIEIKRKRCHRCGKFFPSAVEIVALWKLAQRSPESARMLKRKRCRCNEGLGPSTIGGVRSGRPDLDWHDRNDGRE